MRSLDREALILDRAIDLMIAGGDVVDDPRVREAAQLFAAIEAIPPTPARERARWRMLAPIPVRRRTWVRWVAAVPAAAVLALGGVAFAARNAMPGDALYGIHRTEEASRIAFTAGRVAHASARLDRAAGDLVDARSLIARKRPSDARDALKLFQHDLSDARREIAALPATDRADLNARADALASDADTLEAQINAVGLGDGQGSGLSDDHGVEGRGTPEVEQHGGTSGDGSGSTTTSGFDDTHSTTSSDDSHSGTSGDAQSTPTATATPTDDGHGGDSTPSLTPTATSHDGGPSPGESPH